MEKPEHRIEITNIQRVYHLTYAADDETIERFDAGDVVWLNQHIPPSSKALRLAVKHAIAAYQKTGKMFDAALAYARFGLPVFPCDPVSKVPAATKVNGVPGTGGVYRATTDRQQINEWWRENPRYLIGMPMGPRSGVWTLDIDTAEDHDDGTVGWNTLAAQHEAFETREHRSATDGPHLIFAWDPEWLIRCSSGALPKGMEVKGQGGYVVVPPSQRKGRSYTVYRDIDPINAPQWLVDLILQGRVDSSDNGEVRPFDGKPEVSEDELAEIMSFVPNDDLSWDEWASIALAMFAASGGSGWGCKIFDAWSEKSFKYDQNTTRQRWEEIKGSPPNRTGVGKLRKIAREHGWTPRLYSQPPIYPDEGAYISPAKRAEIRKTVREFLDGPKRSRWIDWIFYCEWSWSRTEAWRDWNHERCQGRVVEDFKFDDFVPPPVVWAIKVIMGGGKTSIAIEEIARWLKEHPEVTIIFQVTTHALAEEVKAKFMEQGIIRVQIIRGYLAPDPDSTQNKVMLKRDPNTPKEKLMKMCLMPEMVATAMKAKLPISETCCKNGKKQCVYYDGSIGPICSFQAQMTLAKDNPPQVFITCSDMLFFDHKVFDNVKKVFVDENFWQKGLRGIKDKDDDAEDELKVSLARLLIQPDDDGVIDMKKVKKHELYRDELGHALQRQPDLGGLDSQYFCDRISSRNCRDAINAEWDEYKRLGRGLGLYPGMPLRAFSQIKKEVIEDMRLSRLMITIWEEIREMLRHPEVSISGRLLLAKRDGLCCITWRGIETIHKPFNRLPTLLLDAILPRKKILKLFYPSMQLVADINARSSRHTHTQQVRGAPTSANKIVRAEGETNRLRVWRYILQEYLLIGRRDTLVICQKKFEVWLRGKGLPANIFIEHYYNISGKDIYKNVALGILVGAPRPGPREIEEIAGALSGEWQVPVPKGPTGFIWYPATEPAPGIRLIDGGDAGIRTVGDCHPEAMSEMVRWLYTEGELVNAFGRFRSINRTAENPGEFRLLFDTYLPISVNDVVKWKEPSQVIEPGLEGMIPKQPDDLMTLWPERWKTIDAARWALKDGAWMLGFLLIEYRFAGTHRNKPGTLRGAYYDPRVIPDPMAWLEERLGRPLVWASEFASDLAPAVDLHKIGCQLLYEPL
jgi:hypothetical protein